jgi:hypothetical protein
LNFGSGPLWWYSNLAHPPYFNNQSHWVIDTCYVHFSYYETSDFWISIQDYDLTTLSSGGGIYYQNLNSQSLDFNSIASDLHRLNSNFQPTNLFRITYYNVPSKFGDYVITAQIVLASDSTKSYVLLKYASCIPDAVLRKASGLYYFSSLNGQHVSNEISNACTSSNVNLDGTWVFDVTISFSINSNFSSELLKYMLTKHLNFRAVIQFGYGLSEKRLEKSIFERKAFSRTWTNFSLYKNMMQIFQLLKMFSEKRAKGNIN